MSREDFIKIDGVILDSLPGGKYSVQLDGGTVIRAYVAGHMRINNIKIIPGDKVAVEITPYDVTNGRIVYRYK